MLFPTLDFETRSKAELKKVGAYRYARDPSTRVLCLAYDLRNGEGPKSWDPRKPLPWDLIEHVFTGGIIESHNAEFEFNIWNLVLARDFDFPKLEIPQMRCSAAIAAALSLPRALEMLAPALGLDVNKDLEGKKIMQKLTKPRKATKNDSSEWHENEADFERLLSYNVGDIIVEMAASEKMPPLSGYEQKVFEFTMRMNERGIFCDLDLCRKALAFCTQFEGDLTEELQELTFDEVQTAKQRDKMIGFLAKVGVNVEGLTAKIVKDKLEEKDLEVTGKRVLEIRQALAKSSISKFKAMLLTACDDGRIRGAQLYHGAGTGRFTGRGIQPHNFVKATIKDVDSIYRALSIGDYDFFRECYPNVFEALSSALRGMLRAAPGNTLIAADFAAIEARVVLWLAGADSALEIFRKGGDIYLEMASEIYGYQVTAKEKNKRQLGKQAILGSGFGMGHKKFRDTCLGYGMDVSEELAKTAVQSYREKFPEVKALWKLLENGFIRAIETHQLVVVGKVKMKMQGRYLFVKLPSGRKLSYYEPRISITEGKFGAQKRIRYRAVHPKTKQWVLEDTYGGKITENIVQGIARDLMVEAMIRVEDAGYPVVLTVHDEIVSEIPEDFGSLEEYEKLMAVVPAWADGCPINVEGWRGLRFRK